MFGFLAQLLSWCYGVWPNYAAMILLFTLIIMVVVTPFTIKGMRSAAEMARIQPEMKKLQDQYKNDRIKQNEEMQALFKEHGVNPLGGCLPTLLPLPIFFIIFRLLERMNARKSGALAPVVRLIRGQVGGTPGYVQPHYLSYKATLTQAIIHSNGQLKAFGMDLALAARNHHPSVGSAIPYWILIAVMTLSQYWQQHQINQRNPAAANANPQMKMTMQLFPAFYAIISINIPAAVVFYLLVSGLFRMAQNTLSYRFDPVLARAAASIGTTTTIDATSRPKGGAAAKAALSGPKQGAGERQKSAARSTPPAKPAASGGWMARLREQAAEQAKARAEQSGPAAPKTSTGGTGTNGANGNRRKGADAAGSTGSTKSAAGTAKSSGSPPAKATGTPKRPPAAKTTPPARKATKPAAARAAVPEPVAAAVPDEPVEIDEPAGVIEAAVIDAPVVEVSPGMEETVGSDDTDGFDETGTDEVEGTEPAAPQSNGGTGGTRSSSPLSVRRAAPRATKRPKDR